MGRKLKYPKEHEYGKTTKCSCKLWSIPGIQAVISDLDVKRTPTTLRKVEFSISILILSSH